jgi:putative membrane protein
MLRIALAASHLLALALGLGAVFVRSGALLARPLSRRDLARAFKADAFWGVAAFLWIGTGLWRLLGSTEKSTSYYWGNHAFLTKIGLFGAILLLELYPMITLIRWRRAAARGGDGWVPPEHTARRIAGIGHLEALLVIVMVVLATAMARGYGVK